MSGSNQDSADSSDVDLILAEYYRRIDAGETVDRDQFIAEHPDYADSLRDVLSADAYVDHVIEQRDQTDASYEKTYLSDAESVEKPAGPVLRYFGDYELQDEIARGGMGIVYKARQVSLNRTVAIKMILAGQLATDSDVRRFQIEAEAAASLDHPGIVPIYEIGIHDGQHYFSMALIEGESLAHEIKDGPLDFRTAARHVQKVAEAVGFAHDNGVVHRDLKPGNVLIDANDQPKVTDFGLAKRYEDDSELTSTGQILGTPGYMAPEQTGVMSEEVGPLSDVYAMGALLYCLITGRPPFQSANVMDTLMQVVHQQPVPPRQLNEQIPKDLETICLKCLEKDKLRRYSNARELAEDWSSPREVGAQEVW